MKTTSISKFIFFAISLLFCMNLYAEEEFSKLLSGVVDGYGTVKQISDIGSPRQIIIFEESHNSLTGQVEIAAMINRLYYRTGLHDLVLEGAVSDEDVDFSTYHQETYKSWNIETGLLELHKGNLTAPEFAAIVFDDFKLHPGEIESEREITMPDNGGVVILYLAKVALSAKLKDIDSLKHDEREKLIATISLFISNESIDAKTANSSLENIINSYQPTKVVYDKIFSGDCEYSAIPIQDVIKIAHDFNIKLDTLESQAVNFINLYKKFNEMANKRSITMAQKTLSLIDKNNKDKFVVSLNIGACHTKEIVGFFSEYNKSSKTPVSFAVLTPASYVDDSFSIDIDGYDVKLQRKSVEQSVNSVNRYVELSALMKQFKPLKDNDAKYKSSPFSTGSEGRLEMFFQAAVSSILKAANTDKDLTKLALPLSITDTSSNYYVDVSSIKIKTLDGKKVLSAKLSIYGVDIYISSALGESYTDIQPILSEEYLNDKLQGLLASLRASGRLKLDSTSMLMTNDRRVFFGGTESEANKLLIQNSSSPTGGSISPVRTGVDTAFFLGIDQETVEKAAVASYTPD